MKRVCGIEADSLDELEDRINHQVDIWEKRIEDVQYQVYTHPTEGIKFTALFTYTRRD